MRVALTILAMHGAAACRQGEMIEARWIDGTFKVATIMEVRDRPDGTCGQYKLSWYHSRVCEDSTNEYWGDTARANGFCVVSRDAIRKCKEKLCEPASAADKKARSSSNDESSSKATMVYISLGCLGLAACCACMRCCCQAFCQSLDEVDEEKGSDRQSPIGRFVLSPNGRGNALWPLSPASIASSPVGKWFDTTRRQAQSLASSPVARWIGKPVWPSNKSKKSVVQPEPIAAAVAEKHAQPQPCTKTIQDYPHLQRSMLYAPHVQDYPPGLSPGMIQTTPPSSASSMIQTQDGKLREAARAYAPPQQQWRQSRTNHLTSQTKSMRRPPALEYIA